MRLVDSGTEVRGGRRRTIGTVLLSDGSREEYWFEVPAEAGAGHRGDPWAIALLPLAMSRAEPLEIPLPVDPVLLRNLELLQGVWHAWYPALTVVDLTAREAARSSPAPGVVSCFSGGVDSFFTLIRNHRRFPAGHEWRITSIMLVHGADVPVDDADTYDALRGRYGTLASEFGINLVDPRTNFRSASLGRLSWPDLTHAACLAACASSIGAGIGCLLIPSGAPYPAAIGPWGSTPLTDPLFSSSRIRVEHDGAQFARPEKIEYLSTHPIVRTHLRVCWRSNTDQNCGRCAKCFRTMAALDAIGELDAFTVFPRDTYSHDMLAKVYCRSPTDYRQLRMVHGVALSRGRKDLARAVSHAIARSDAVNAARTVVGFLERPFGRRGLGEYLDRRAVTDAITD